VINLETKGAVALSALPVHLIHVRDIEEFDGALISEFRTAGNGSGEETFLYVWSDCEDALNRWLVVRTPPQILFRYLVGRTQLRDVILKCQDQFVYFVDLDPSANYHAVWHVLVNHIPVEYLPSMDSFHQRDEATLAGFQDVYVGQTWDYEDVARYPRKYLQAYYFHAAFGPGGDADPLRASGVDYRLTQGWIFHTLFERMRYAAPSAKRAKLSAVGFASPGYLRFDVDGEIAEGVRQAVVNYRESEASIEEDAKLLQRWSNGREKELQEDEVRALIFAVCKRVGLRGRDLLASVKFLPYAAKALVSYLRRIAFLNQQDLAESAMLVGLPQRRRRSRRNLELPPA
jgi:hypothetical protein